MTNDELIEFASDLMRGWVILELKHLPKERTLHQVNIPAYAKEYRQEPENILKAIELLKKARLIKKKGQKDDWTITLM